MNHMECGESYSSHYDRMPSLYEPVMCVYGCGREAATENKNKFGVDKCCEQCLAECQEYDREYERAMEIARVQQEFINSIAR